MKLSVYLDNLLAMLQCGSLTKLAVSLPPRSGKTTWATEIAAKWKKDRPDDRIMVSSYGPGQSKRIRAQAEILAGPAGLVGLPIMSVPVGCSPSGGFDLIVIDDPVKSKSEGDSPAMLERIWEWVTGILCRLSGPDARMVVIGSRWSAYDPIGRILAGHAGEGWTVVNVPAVALQDDPLGRQWGESLWTEGRTGADLLKTRSDFGAVNWATTWQGRPPDDGFPVSADPHWS